jgi:SAM-dependent methyltransferase
VLPDVRRLAELIQELTRELTAGTPPPRGLPYLGLEHTSGTGAHLLDALSTHGIFRKYESVLELGAGLGGNARYLAARLGCDVVAVTATSVEAEAARALNRRTGVRLQVRFVPADLVALPFRPARFTHVWIVEKLARATDPAAVLAEAFRLVRPGGHLAVQELVPAAAGNAHAETIGAAGFVELEVRDVSGHAAERSARVGAAREHLLERARTRPGLEAVIEERRALADAIAGGRLRVLQLFARRP